jgi:hypothetical protein
MQGVPEEAKAAKEHDIENGLDALLFVLLLLVVLVVCDYGDCGGRNCGLFV